MTTKSSDLAEQAFAQQTKSRDEPTDRSDGAQHNGQSDHHVPVRKSRLVRLLLEDSNLHNGDVGAFEQCCRLMSAIVHFQYHEWLETLKDVYAPFNPDAVTWEPKTLTDEPCQDEQCHSLIPMLFDRFTALLERANYRRLSREEIEAAIGVASDWGVRLHVDFTVFVRTKEKYQLNLTRSLYYQHLDNNAGVICRVLDEAEEQELVEAILAYALLHWNAREAGWTAEQLDQQAEHYLREVLHRMVDFEVHGPPQALVVRSRCPTPGVKRLGTSALRPKQSVAIGLSAGQDSS